LYIDELEPEQGSASIFTVFGSAFHRCSELYFKFGIDLNEITTSWKSLFLSFCIEEKTLTIPNKNELQKFIDKGYEYLSNFSKMKDRWEKYKVIAIESYHRIPYSNKFIENVFITGRIDLLLSDIETMVCLDWKTAKSKEKDVDKNVQLTFYIYFINKVYKYSLDKIYASLAYPFDKEILFTQRQKEDFDELFRKIDVMLERISKSDFIKEPKRNFLPDDCFFCQYKKLCNS
jgi:ATP-dependent exoDNAse (exonuclease V) beta subunit